MPVASEGSFFAPTLVTTMPKTSGVFSSSFK